MCLGAGAQAHDGSEPFPENGQPTICDLMSDRLLVKQNTDPAVPKFGFGDLEDENIQGLKSPMKALVLSLLVPGTGQLYAGANNHHRLFFTTEAAAWLAFGAFTKWSSSKEDEYQAWAAEHAGVDPEGKPKDFWQMMTYYESREEYELYGRAGEPDRVSYPNLVGWDWQWDSEESRTEYRELRNQSKEADRKASFSLGALARLMHFAARGRIIAKKRWKCPIPDGGLKVRRLAITSGSWCCSKAFFKMVY